MIMIGQRRKFAGLPADLALVLCATVAAALVVTNGCARSGNEPPRNTVLTSVTPLGSIMRNVFGDRLAVESLVTPDSVASGRIEPLRRFEIEALEERAIGGIFLGTFDREMAIAVSDAIAPSIYTSLLSELSPSLVAIGDFPWVDPLTAQAIATEVAKVASDLSPQNRDYFGRNLNEFASALRRIDEVISETASTVPAERRKIAATTESLRPFFARYGFTYFSATSSKDPASFAETIMKEGITAVYVNEFGSNSSIQFAREAMKAAGAQFQGRLLDAGLPGPAGSLYHTYFGMLIENARQAFGPLGADLSKLDSLRPVDVAL